MCNLCAYLFIGSATSEHIYLNFNEMLIECYVYKKKKLVEQ